MKKCPCLQIVMFTLSLLLTISTSGCEPGLVSRPEPIEQSFLADQPDVLRVLAELPFVNQATTREESYELYGREEIAITCQFKNQNGFGVGINIYDDIVRQITLASHGLNLEDVAQKLGDPDHVRVFLYGKGASYQVDIFYVRRGIQVRNFQTIDVLLGNKYLTRSSDGPWRVLLSKEMQVDNLIYIPPAASIEEFYASQIPYDPDAVKGILEYISPWPGWGESVPLN
jgi:hypothetical protein